MGLKQSKQKDNTILIPCGNGMFSTTVYPETAKGPMNKVRLAEKIKVGKLSGVVILNNTWFKNTNFKIDALFMVAKTTDKKESWLIVPNDEFILSKKSKKK
jgi:hypothetical protein